MRADVELVATTNLAEDVRAVKAPDEIELIRRAADHDEIYAWLAYEGLDGTQRDWRRRSPTDPRARRRRRAFHALVTSGGTAPRRTRVPGDEPIARNTLVVLDLGAVVGGYCSDCTRTFATGHTDDAMREVYEVVLAAQEAALALVKPGTSCIEVHETARRVISDAGYGDYFNHGTGHGVGVEIHEEPRFRSGSGARSSRATSSPSSPACTFPGDSACGSRISSSSPRTGTRCSTQVPEVALDVG